MHEYSVLEIQSLFSFKIRWHRFTSITVHKHLKTDRPVAGHFGEECRSILVWYRILAVQQPWVFVVFCVLRQIYLNLKGVERSVFCHAVAIDVACIIVLLKKHNLNSSICCSKKYTYLSALIVPFQMWTFLFLITSSSEGSSGLFFLTVPNMVTFLFSSSSPRLSDVKKKKKIITCNVITIQSFSHVKYHPDALTFFRWFPRVFTSVHILGIAARILILYLASFLSMYCLKGQRPQNATRYSSTKLRVSFSSEEDGSSSGSSSTSSSVSYTFSSVTFMVEKMWLHQK